MNKERVRRIISYSKKNSLTIASLVKKIYAYAGLDGESEILNTIQIAREVFNKKGFLVLEIPFIDDEIGALSYRGEGLGYVVINTSLPKVNVHFALAHELYHVFFGIHDFTSKVEFSDDYYEQEEEYAANLFAGIILMPEISFIRMYTKYIQESNNDILDTIIKLISYYQAPYTSVLIRCFELGLFDIEKASDSIFQVSKELIRQKLEDLWIDTTIMDPSLKNDYSHLLKLIDRFGKECVDDELINQRTLDMVIENIQTLYSKIGRK